MDSRLPRMVMEGVSFPSLKRVSLSIFAYGSLGFGSLGVPSTLAHFPMVLSHPTMLFKTQEWSWKDSDRAETGSKQRLWIYTQVWYEAWSNQIKTGRVYSEAKLVKQTVLVGKMKIQINKSSQPRARLETSSHQRRVMKLFLPPNHWK